ncbi:hypothetical protein [Pedobacter sp. NJ-S-72]
MLSRGSLYDLSSFKAEYGYLWKENQYKEHTFNPISLTYVRPSITTKDTAGLYRDNPGLKNILDKQFIIGSSYNFTYTNQMEEARRNNIYFNGNIQTGGNIWGLFIPKDGKGEKTILKVPLTQFVRLETDLRDYYKVNRNVIGLTVLTWGMVMPTETAHQCRSLNNFSLVEQMIFAVLLRDH